MLRGYAGVSGRLVPRGFLMGLTPPLVPHYALLNLVVYALLGPMMTTMTVELWRERKSVLARPLACFSLAAILTGLAGMGTNFDFKLTDTPLVILGVALYAIGRRDGSGSPLRFRLCATTLALVVLSMYVGRTRYHLLWFEAPCENVRIDDRFLGAMQVCSPILGTMQETDRILAGYPHARIFFGPGLEFLYAARAVPSPAHLPNWWDAGTSYPIGQTEKVVAAWQEDRFEVLILKGDMHLYLPEKINRLVETQFVPIPGTSAVQAYKRR